MNTDIGESLLAVAVIIAGVVFLHAICREIYAIHRRAIAARDEAIRRLCEDEAVAVTRRVAHEPTAAERARGQRVR